MDRYKALFTGPAIDVASEIGRLLPDGDQVLVHSQVVPSGFTRGGGGVGVDGRLMNLVTSAVETAVSRSQHTGGEEGSTARTLPNEAGPSLMVISEQSLSMWDLGLTGNQLPAEHLVTIPRAQVASIVDTGKTAQGGVPVARLTFADGSFADQRLISKPGPEFWSVAAAI
ncbi:hypothetical protein [Curtobacterium citreum]|uniref:hypothetical protein n=1 Tax=Curtobacterium citreum TaxID=2036 RepID=UPI000737365A|nr:hypothetical protein [Curtobacterium citreum]KTR19821.1 hypothetical protein NS330_07285 [Curtobacterium citreum]